MSHWDLLAIVAGTTLPAAFLGWVLGRYGRMKQD